MTLYIGLHVAGAFTVCGLMTTGRRNRMCKSFEMSAFLKLNSVR